MYILELFNAGYSYAGITGVFYIWKPPIPQYFANIDAQNIERVEDLILSLDDKKVFIVTHQLNEKIKEKAASLWKIGA